MYFEIKSYVLSYWIYIKEESIIHFSKDKPVVHNCCPADKKTKRQYFKELLARIEKENPHAKEHMLNALIHSERANLFPTTEEFVLKHNNKITVHLHQLDENHLMCQLFLE